MFFKMGDQLLTTPVFKKKHFLEARAQRAAAIAQIGDRRPLPATLGLGLGLGLGSGSGQRMVEYELTRQSAVRDCGSR